MQGHIKRGFREYVHDKKEEVKSRAKVVSVMGDLEVSGSVVTGTAGSIM